MITLLRIAVLYTQCVRYKIYAISLREVNLLDKFIYNRYGKVSELDVLLLNVLGKSGNITLFC
jgi:hypothetical protein